MRIVGEYSDEGKSGKNVAGRPEFRKMLADIKSGKDNVDYVLVFKLSRFGRNTADTLNSLQYMYQRSELDWLIYNKPLEYAQLVLDGNLERYVRGTPEHRLID